MNKAGNNSLKKNYSAWAIFSIVNNTKIDARPVLAWRIVNGKKLTVEVFFRVIRKFRDEVVVRATRPEGQKILGNLVAGSDKLNFFLPEDMVLFQTDVKSVDASGELVIKLPEMIAQIDRRKHMRLSLSDDVGAVVKFFKENTGQVKRTQLFDKACFDVSAGGLSLVVSKTEAKFFSIGDVVNRIRLEVENKEIPLSAEVVNILDIEPDGNNKLHYSGKKICLRYSKIGPKAQKFLNEFVFRHVDLNEAV